MCLSAHQSCLYLTLMFIERECRTPHIKFIETAEHIAAEEKET